MSMGPTARCIGITTSPPPKWRLGSRAAGILIIRSLATCPSLPLNNTPFTSSSGLVKGREWTREGSLPAPRAWFYLPNWCGLCFPQDWNQIHHFGIHSRGSFQSHYLAEYWSSFPFFWSAGTIWLRQWYRHSQKKRNQFAIWVVDSYVAAFVPRNEKSIFVTQCCGTHWPVRHPSKGLLQLRPFWTARVEICLANGDHKLQSSREAKRVATVRSL
jgi:hypothetical protein